MLFCSENTKEDLKITKIPIHLRTNWDSYYLEFIMLAALAIYFLTYISGRSKNYKIANGWFEKSHDLLSYNFALVGDDGEKEIQNQGLIKETDNVFTLWCSGRAQVDGLLAEIQLIKRQDLFSIFMNYFKPSSDKIVRLNSDLTHSPNAFRLQLLRVFLSPDTLDNFVFCIAQRKVAAKLSKDINDIVSGGRSVRCL